MSYEKTSYHSGRIGKEHSDFRPEVPVREVMRSSFERIVEFFLINDR